MGIQGNSKATHDFLSLYASAAGATGKDPSLQLHDSKPPAAPQGFFLKTHDFLQPLEKPAAASVPDRQQQHALPGGIGTFTVSQQVPGAGARPAPPAAAVVVKPEPPPLVLCGQPTAAQPISAQPGAGHHHQWTLPFAGAGQAATAPRQHPPERKRRAGGRAFMESGSRSNGGDGFDDDDGLDDDLVLQDLAVRVDGKGGSCSGSGTDQRPNTPNSKHSATEQRRRSKINDRFQILRDLLPHTDQKRDKAAFLLEVIEYIRFLQEKAQKYEASFPEWNQENAKLLPWSKGQIPGDALPGWNLDGNSKATHDFLSLYASAAGATGKDPSLQLHDSKPPAASQGFFLKTHDFLQPLEKPAASVPDRQQQHALPGGIGTFTVSQQAPGAGARPAPPAAAVVVKPEPPPFVLWGQPMAAQPISSQQGMLMCCQPTAAQPISSQPDIFSDNQILKYTAEDMEIDTALDGEAWLEQNLQGSGTPETSQKCTDDLATSPKLEQDERLVLQRTLSDLHDLIKRAEWWVHRDAFANFQIEKDAVYCAEDLLDELNYYELQDKIEGRTIRSECLESCDVKMKEAKGKLDHFVKKMGHLSIHDVRQLLVDESICQESNLIKGEQAIFGRQRELIELIGMLDFQENSPTVERVSAATTVPDRDRAKKENVSVLPIVGTGGVGKTTLAHHILCDKRVKDHFDLLIWISLSDGFDAKKLIKKLIESVAESEMKSDDLSYLQRILTNGIIHHSRRFFLVLDDAQEDICREDCHGWESFLAPLKCAKPGSMIFVTTKSLRVGERLGTMKPFVLEGLPKETLWDLFRMHALGSDNSDSNPVFLSIGRSIVSRLNGSPLDAKIIGRLLNRKLDPLYWKNILESELWELPHQVKGRVFTHKQEENNSISSALKLSYQYLPFHLKRCFSFCSLYPRNYEFNSETLVDCWVAVGLVLPYGGMLAIDVGHMYFQQLVNRSFFQKTPMSSRHVMHDLLYDMAEQTSMNECFMINASCGSARFPPNVRHLSVIGNRGLKSSDLESLNKYKTLSSVICISIDSDILTTSVVETWFHDLVNIRMLRLIHCQLKELPKNVGNLIHLRYLDISACDFDGFPDSFWRLYKLEILDARNCKIQDVPKDIIKLVNLQRVILKDDLIRQLGCVPRVGNLVFLQEMPYYAVGVEPGRTIHELKNMNHLRGILEISGLCNVISMEQSSEASLDKKIYLNTLILLWHESIRPEKYNNSQEMEVLEGLRPSSSIKHLEVKFYMGAVFHPSWLQEVLLSSLASLSISSCPNIATLFYEPSRTEGSSSTGSLTAFRSLTKLCISWCKRLSGLDNFLHAEYLPAIKVIRISNCEDLVSLPTKSLVEFVHLEDLEVSHCWSLNWEQGLTLPPSLKLLKLEACGEFSDSTLSCLLGLAALTNLDLQFCPSIKSICAQIWSDLVSLENLKIVCCQGLNSMGGSESIARIRNVDIRHCPKLKELQQPCQRGCYS